MLALWIIQRWRKYYSCPQVTHNLLIILNRCYPTLINMKLEKKLLTDIDLLIDVTGK